MRFSPTLAAGMLLLAGGWIEPSFATFAILTTWQGIYPESTSDGDDECRLCHRFAGGGDGWNAYGWAVREAFYSSMSIAEAIASVENINADTDPTQSWNLTEIIKNTQPGWTPGPVNVIYFINGSTMSGQLPTSSGLPLDPGENGQPQNINLMPPELDFGVIESGTVVDVDRVTTIRNFGQQTLALGSIDRCAESPVEFTSNQSGENSLELGEEQDMIVTFTPDDTGIESGCIDVPSNDPDQPGLVLPVIAHVCADVDTIVDAEFDTLVVPSEGQVGGIPLEVSVSLASTCSSPSGTPVTIDLIGKNDSATVYDESVVVDFLALAGKQQVEFPLFRPKKPGIVQWTATLTDDHADVDVIADSTDIAPQTGPLCFPVVRQGGGLVQICY